MSIDHVGELTPDQRIIVAYDRMSLYEAVDLHRQFNNAGYHPKAKIHTVATRIGLDAVMTAFDALGADVMYDPKYFDSDATMYHYIQQIQHTKPAPPKMITLHASNRMEALQAAVRARDETDEKHVAILDLLGVTILTSFDDGDVRSVFGEGTTAESKFVDFAHRAREAGLQGLVSSGRELVKGYEYKELDGLLRVIPGIKLPGTADTAGQKRLYTPDWAISEGAHFVVIGRAITNAAEPVAALEQAIALVDKEM